MKVSLITCYIQSIVIHICIKNVHNVLWFWMNYFRNPTLIVFFVSCESVSCRWCESMGVNGVPSSGCCVLQVWVLCKIFYVFCLAIRSAMIADYIYWLHGAKEQNISKHVKLYWQVRRSKWKRNGPNHCWNTGLMLQNSDTMSKMLPHTVEIFASSPKQLFDIRRIRYWPSLQNIYVIINWSTPEGWWVWKEMKLTGLEQSI